jgi:hypothetical protein
MARYIAEVQHTSVTTHIVTMVMETMAMPQNITEDDIVTIEVVIPSSLGLNYKPVVKKIRLNDRDLSILTGNSFDDLHN